MGKRYIFRHNSFRCTKCYACEIACQQWHGIPAGTIKLRRVSEEVRGTFPNVLRIFHSVSCLHCSDAPCLDACPENAITKREEDGIVTVDSNKCTGCRTCMDVCPIGIPQFNAAGIMQICDMCVDRLAVGKNPICSEACPTKALNFDLV
ncbi:MAG: 4Fe-4S dicluster domain-containing protein [Dehalococcoidales bacterium]|nr:4Fe-4S dicluster domain-containing protein [Dehalococcoidales bacterium]